MAAPHDGQREFGNTMDSSRGNLWMMTFRKLPMTAPKIPARMYPKTGGSKLKVGVTSSSGAGIAVDCNVLPAVCAWNFGFGLRASVFGLVPTPHAKHRPKTKNGRPKIKPQSTIFCVAFPKASGASETHDVLQSPQY